MVAPAIGVAVYPMGTTSLSNGNYQFIKHKLPVYKKSRAAGSCGLPVFRYKDVFPLELASSDVGKTVGTVANSTRANAGSRVFSVEMRMDEFVHHSSGRVG